MVSTQLPSIQAAVRLSQNKIKAAQVAAIRSHVLIKKQPGLRDQSSSRGLCQAWIIKHLLKENALHKL